LPLRVRVGSQNIITRAPQRKARLQAGWNHQFVILTALRGRYAA